MEFADELECLNASYSPEELEILSSGQSETILKFTISLNPFLASQLPTLCITFKVASSYPMVIPETSVSCSSFTNAQRRQIENEIQERASSLVGSPMLMDLVVWIKERANQVLEVKEHALDAKTNNVMEEETFLTVIVIDHMRSKSSYIKTLKAWSSELDVNGALLFCQKKIFLILQGTKQNIKNFGIHLKTMCIDVDSSGKRCKERMSKTLFEEFAVKCYDVFSVEEFNSFLELEQYLNEKSISHMSCFKDHFIYK